MSTSTVYSKPHCVRCAATYRALEYVIVGLSADEAGLQSVKDLGYQQAPVIVTATDYWSGFRPDKISALAKERSLPE